MSDVESLTPMALSADTLYSLVADAGVGVFVTARDGRFVYANRKLAQQLGYASAEELLAAGTDSIEVYADPEDRRRIRAANDKGETVRDRIVLARRRDGSTFWASEQATPTFDEAGWITGYFGTVSDVTELIETQRKLAEAETDYRRIFERATQGIYRSSLDGKQLRANPALAALNGYASEEELLQAVQNIATEWYVDPTRRDEFKRLLERDGAVTDFESEIYRHRTRERIWISENAYLVRDEAGNPLYYEGTVHDITARKEAERASREARERAEAANRTKTDFLAHMSHELRTPLNAVLGFADVLRTMGGRLPPDKIAEYAEHIHDSGSYLLELISDVLDLSRIETGAQRLALQPVDAAEAVGQALETVRPMADARGLTLAFDPGPGGAVTADRRALRQCLLNLLSNAVKFAADGSTVTVDVARPDSGRLRLRVSDRGPGMPERVLERLGEPFVTDGRSRAAAQSGSGLGLAITRSLVEQMDGELTVANRESGGTCACLILPEAG